MRCALIPYLLASVLPSLQLGAATVLLDFEADRDVALWHNEGAATLGADKTLERVSRYATSGRFAMRFTTPAWLPQEHGGQQRWPAFEGKPPITDWSPYDRLVFDIVNETDQQQRLMLFISDSKKPTREGLTHKEILPPNSHVRAVIDLVDGFRSRQIDAADIQVMHIFTEDPPVDMVVSIDTMILLKVGESLPLIPPQFIVSIAALQAREIASTRADIDGQYRAMLAKAQGTPILADWMENESADVLRRLNAIEAQLAQPDESILTAPRSLQAIRQRIEHLDSLLQLRLDFEAVRAKLTPAGVPRHDLALAIASSMERILPRGPKPRLKVTDSMHISLAANETESAQIIIVPCERDAKQVQVRLSEMVMANGTVLAGTRIDCVPMGYVETKAVPPYGSSYVGWWPDPILDFMSGADIAQGDAQSFWVRVRAPKDQPPGVYAGKAAIWADGAHVLDMPLEIRIFAFALPDGSPLPLAITFAPQDLPIAETEADQALWRQEDNYPVNAWRKHTDQWADFLADYYITMDSLYQYAGWEPAFEQLSRLQQEGRLGRYNLGYFTKCTESPEAIAAWKQETISRLQPRYDKAKQLGILKQAYIYGCDEHVEADFPHVNRAAELLKKAFPDVLIMTTTYDHSFGLDSVLKAPDAYCPLTPRYDAARAARSRSGGKQVWWYICCGPAHPHANMFIEYPAIEGRLLMGAMTAKYRPDGFLYYQISIWNSQHCIETGPFTDWDPRSWTTWHGDGSWTCVGPDGTPLPTIRLENFRDGLEDYAYARILETTLAKVQGDPVLAAAHQEWIAQARSTVTVPDELVHTMAEFSSAPALLLDYRNAMAETIEAAPIAPVYPTW